MNTSRLARSAAFLASATLLATTLTACGDDDSPEASIPSPSETTHLDETSDDEEEHGDDAHHFDYDEDSDHGPAAWGDQPGWERCSTGEQQSPIDVPTAKTINLTKQVKINWNTGSVSALNNAHTINVRPDGDNTVTYKGKTFGLAQFHLHADSEHELDGKASPLEAHFVHGLLDEDGEFVMKEDTDTGEEVLAELLAIGVMIDEGKANDSWGRILRAEMLPAETSDEYELVDEAAFDPTTLLPKKKRAHAYTGSLTTPTPTCMEGVNWFVLTTPVTASAEQIEAFTDLYDNNSRPVQER